MTCVPGGTLRLEGIELAGWQAIAHSNSVGRMDGESRPLAFGREGVSTNPEFSWKETMKKISICLSCRERALILQYGYPFDGIENQLERHARSKSDVSISDDSFWWEQVAGQLAITVNEELEPDTDAWEEVNELADRIEAESSLSGR